MKPEEKKSNQEIIDAIIGACDHSFIRKDKQGTTNFCLHVNVDYEKETLKNFLVKAGLKGTHLGKLRRAKIVESYVIDDGALIMRFKDSFLTDEQRKGALEYFAEQLERDKKYEAEEAKKKHAEKCVAMLPKLAEALKEITQFGKCKDKKFSCVTSEERLAEYKQLIAEAEQK